MRWDDIGFSLCPIARSLAVVGDRWTLLILRELGMGMHRFEEVQAQTGMSSHLLSTRLKRLKAEGVIEWHLYSAKPARYEYAATTKGKELDAVLLALQAWGQKWGDFDPQAEPSLTWVLKETGQQIGPFLKSPSGDKPFTFDDATPVISAAFQAEREARRLAFLAFRRDGRGGRK
ncbi:helix-turn-helix domain-containing protein [Paraburkholderia sp. BL25I1N1]|uniref:winged helix-turn-helix transcriptional regulator n=1 Tax=Paraburkholderia sp. BL25I1N1 TaxID=1938804 RepID=UPI000D06C906|nr:helix-turn-helix domain-containing protein [Paraburkholderia sp. BL25I1N1]PRY04431.1 HxlR family transcriptional regulator [Paraburkholderia sp. BL25I1N1]